MRLDFAGERVLAVVAHPDDAELLCAGTLARAKDDGAAIGILVLCHGEKGQPDPPVANLAAVREQEMRASAKLLDAELLTGGFADGELMDDVATRTAVVNEFRVFQPTLVLAHSAVDYHPDHRAAGALAEAASWFCASPGWRTGSALVERPPALWWMDAISGADFAPGFYVDVSKHLELKRRMLACHASQLARRGEKAFAPLEELMLSQATRRGAECGVEAAEAFACSRLWKRLKAF